MLALDSPAFFSRLISRCRPPPGSRLPLLPCPSPGSRLPLLPCPSPGSRLPLLPCPSPGSRLPLLPCPSPGSRLPLLPCPSPGSRLPLLPCPSPGSRLPLLPCPSPGSRLPPLPSPPPGSRLPLLPSPSPRSGLSIQYIILPLSVLIENKPSFVSHLEVCSVLHLGSYFTCHSTIWPRMDPAHASSLQSWFEQIENTLQQQEARIASATAEIQQATANQAQGLATLASQVQQLAASIAQSVAASVPPAPTPPVAVPSFPGLQPESRVGPPEQYTGDPEDCNPFITNCSILFALQPQTFASEQARVAFAINHLTGRARRWGTEWECQTAACSSFQAFTTELRKVFGIASLGPDVTGGLMSMSQGEQTVVHYAIEFRIRARQSSWNKAACCDAYLRGLEDYIKGRVGLPQPSLFFGRVD